MLPVLLDEVRALTRQPRPVLGLATGHTFQQFFDAAVTATAEGTLDLSGVAVTHLDEWVGLPLGTPGGMATEIQERFLDRIPGGVARFVPVPADPVDDGAIDAAHERTLAALGGIGLQFLGIGRNGHIAFNEPGVDLDARTHTTPLTDSTMEANADRFAASAPLPTRARTLGPGTIREARRLVLVATGPKKAAPVKAMLEGPISGSCPASCLRRHPDTLVLLDRAAAQLLNGPSRQGEAGAH